MSDHPARAAVQSMPHHLMPHPARRTGKPGEVPGTVEWAEHLAAWGAYAMRYGRDQSALRLHERAGFCYAELTEYLGHAPRTWEPLK